MKLFNIGHEFNYELENLCRIFYPFEKIKVSNELKKSSEDTIIIAKREISKETNLNVQVTQNDKVISRSQIIQNNINDYKNECERTLAMLLYLCFCEIRSFKPKWGILTGVRPIKLLRHLILEENSSNVLKSKEYFENKLAVSQQKTDLALRTFFNEEKIIKKSDKSSFSLYVSIPFCLSRCNYCSFVSQSVSKALHLIPQYLTLLMEEIKQIAVIADKLNLTLSTIYIGGGTPTSISAEQLKDLLNCISLYFDVNKVLEYTVEAGRPDTIDKKKLEIIKKCGVTRISINPQTMHDATLKTIGRNHTVSQLIESYKLAKDIGLKNINMDLIAGLPGENVNMFKESLDKILDLDPENITMHTLSLKRSSYIGQTGGGKDEYDIVDEMLEYAYKKLDKNKFEPYYLYRQNRILGGLENTGWSKKGFEGLYNVFIMDETHSILAAGAGAVTKLKQPDGSKIERIFNFKFPYEYISGFDEMTERKKKVYNFYDRYNI